MVRWTLERGLVAAFLVMCSVPLSLGISAGFGDLTAAAQNASISSIVVQGNQRVESETIRSYLSFSEGDAYDPGEINQSLKTLFSTGLFKDVRIRRQYSTVVVVVSENPVVARVRFEGNKDVESDTLRSEVQLKPRSVYTQARVQADEQRIRDVLARQGHYDAQVSAQVIPLGGNRVEVVFQIGEGIKTKVRAIHFAGNDAFSASQLRYVITTKRTSWLSFLKNDNIYDPDRLGLDRELLRQFYLKNGYADVRILSSNADIVAGDGGVGFHGGGGFLKPNGAGFEITFEIYEGPRYRFGYVDIESALPSLDVNALGGAILTKPGKHYNVEKIEKTVEALTVKVSEQGYSFGQVRPRFDRDPVTQTINVTYVIDEGPRVYIERINIVGNYRTEDQVIRRQIRLAEGDAYNRLLIEAGRKRLRGLGFFKTVNIETEPGSAADRVVINVVVVEQPTGEFSFGVGYSTTEGVIGDVSITERNLMGRGQYVRLGMSGSFERFQVDFSFTEPAFLGRNIAAGFDLFHKEVDLRDVASFRQRNTGGNLRMGFPVANNTQLGLRYRLNREEIFDATRNASLAIKQAADEGEVWVSSLGYTLAYDTRNLPQSPTSGIFASISQDFAGAGGDVQYNRLILDTRGYYPITNKITFVGRAQGGIIEGWGGEDLRLTDLFFKGGETIRGFDRAGYGPRDACKDPTTGARIPNCSQDAIGGKYFWATTAEVRFPIPLIPESLGIDGAVFVDAGSLWGAGENAIQAINVDEGSFILDTSDIRLSTGVSLIWQSPLGPLRADLAEALLKADFDRTELFRFGASTTF